VLGLNAWGVGSASQNATSWMGKDEDLQEIIQSIHCVYARQLKMAWDVKNWDQESNKIIRIEQITDVLYFHESRMVCER
jgi:hypothetical protein